MDYTVLNATGGSGASEKKKRRRKKKKDAAQATSSSSEHQQVQQEKNAGVQARRRDPIYAACVEKGFSEEEISRGLGEMFDRGLAYDNMAAVLTYLEHRRKAPVEPQEQPRNGHDKHPQAADPAVKPTQIRLPPPSPKKREAVASGASAKERLIHVIKNVKELDAVLDGLKMWYTNADVQSRAALFIPDTLNLLFERIFTEVSELGDVSSAAITKLERQLKEVFTLVLKLGKESAEKLSVGVSSLVIGMLKLRELRSKKQSPDLEISEISKAAAQAVLKVKQEQADGGSQQQQLKMQKPARLRVEDIGTIELGTEEVTKLESSVLPTLPRGDLLLLNKSGKLSAGDVARLFRLRDNGHRLVELSGRCLSLANSAPATSKSATSSITSSIASSVGSYFDIDAMMQKVQQQRNQAFESMKQVQSALDQKRQVAPENLGPIEAKLQDLDDELMTFQAKREKLVAELVALDDMISEKKREIAQVSSSLSDVKSEARREAEDLHDRLSSSHSAVSMADMKLQALSNVKRFQDMVLATVGLQGSGSSPTSATEPSSTSSNDVKSQNPVEEWRNRLFLAIERYLGVENACVNLLRGRSQESGNKIVELEGKVENLKSLGMPSLVEEAQARMNQEIRNKKEDENAIEALRGSGSKVSNQLSQLLADCKRDSNFKFHPKALFALKRCIKHLEALELDSSMLRNEPLLQNVGDEPIDVPQKQAPQPSKKPVLPPPNMPAPSRAAVAPKASTTTHVLPKSTTRGWGAVATPVVAPSLLEIQQAEEAAKEPTKQEEEPKKEQEVAVNKEEAKEEEEPVEPEEEEAEDDDDDDEEEDDDDDDDDEEEEEEDEAEEEEEEEEKPTQTEGEEKQASKAGEEEQPVTSSSAEKKLTLDEIIAKQPTADLDKIDPDMIIYDDDPALGQKCPDMDGLEFFNGNSVGPGQGKALVLTFYSKLNKSDICLLTLLNRIRSTLDQSEIEFVGISRDMDGKPDSFLSKYQGKFMAESPAPDNDESLKTVQIDFPLAFDPDSKFNAALKGAMKKGVVGVGIVIIVDKDGTIRWYEHFARGVNPARQFTKQLKHILNDEPLISNGNAPVMEDEDEDGDENGNVNIPDDLDDLIAGGGGDGY